MSGSEVKKAISESGVSLSEVARRLGISAQALNSKLHANDVKLSTLEEIAKAINKSVYDLVENPKHIHLVVSEKYTPYSYTGVDYATKIKELEERLREKDDLITALQQTIKLYERITNSGLDKTNIA